MTLLMPVPVHQDDGYTFNPLRANSDQKQFSPNNIHTLSRDKVMRINKMITKGKMPWSFIKFSQVILKKIYGDQFGEFVCGYWGLKGKLQLHVKPSLSLWLMKLKVDHDDDVLIFFLKIPFVLVWTSQHWFQRLLQSSAEMKGAIVWMNQSQSVKVETT